jgi:hypothetical protein
MAQPSALLLIHKILTHITAQYPNQTHVEFTKKDLMKKIVYFSEVFSPTKIYYSYYYLQEAEIIREDGKKCYFDTQKARDTIRQIEATNPLKKANATQ